MGYFGKVQVFSLAVLCSILAAKTVSAQGAPLQEGFISIDCGATSNYVESATGLLWVPDSNHTSAGVNSAEVTGATTFSASMSTLRYFPKPQKSCYLLPGTTPNASYMVRHTYWYGNYDKLNRVPTFYVALDAAKAAEINSSGLSEPYVYEHVYKAKRNSITFCLYRDATNSTPFINSLELRPFQTGAYEQNVLKLGGVLSVLYRFNMGGSRDLRFPDDVYDRIWTRWTLDGVKVETLSPVDPNNLPLMPPSAVMKTASSPAVLGPETYLGLIFTLLSAYPSPDTVLNLYFAEISTNSSATSRAFNISLNANTPVVTENPYIDAGGALKADVKSFIGWGAYTTLGITLTPLPTATDPPLLNGVEILFSKRLSVDATDATDVLAIEQIKDALNLTLSSAGDPCLPVPIAWITCSSASPPRIITIRLSNYNLSRQIPTAFASLSALTLLWLDNNALTGVIPDLSKLTSLKSLHLENNALSGTIPTSLGSLPLTELFLQNNKFVGMVPTSLIRTNLLLDLSGNPGITDGRVYSGPSASPSGPPTPSADNGGSKSKPNTTIIAGIVGGIVGALLLIGCVAAIIWIRRNKIGSKLKSNTSLKSSHAPSHKPIESGLVPGAQRYSYAEITAATNGFKKKIGSGGFGPVHYGRLSNGQEVAIKALDDSSQQGAQEFTNEVELLSRIHHRNLVKLLGYCEEGNHRMLVYEFLPKGTVQEHLYGSPRAAREPLDLKLRLDIALNAAQGLEYLHNGCNPNIIHRDIKSNNILLTDKYVAKVADFGLSKLGVPGVAATHVVTDVKGTIGYLDPEYYVSNALTEKSDVFSFGVVLLEILSARPPIDQSIPNQDNRNICNWVRASLQTGNIDYILDPVILREHPNMNVVWKVAELAMLCVEPKGKHRPSMQDVVRELREAISVNGSSGTYDNFVGNSTYQFRPGGASGSGSSKHSLPNDSNNSMVKPRAR
ncbi:hypothetical protein KC19_6G125300 [Ceratodon purpureus]|uniref:non-specific serine/threonine protein kinase n=1 Tax=Ceratodon purpureus TaxID=3225 RepID=A0A8T0HEC2_CERPU|nr:hypothetical protein KC19_6G125300 [Ceratodon purpureus]